MASKLFQLQKFQMTVETLVTVEGKLLPQRWTPVWLWWQTLRIYEIPLSTQKNWLKEYHPKISFNVLNKLTFMHHFSIVITKTHTINLINSTSCLDGICRKYVMFLIIEEKENL